MLNWRMLFWMKNVGAVCPLRRASSSGLLVHPGRALRAPMSWHYSIGWCVGLAGSMGSGRPFCPNRDPLRSRRHEDAKLWHITAGD